jgi:hypothetical protein
MYESGFGRLIGVLISPRKTFAAIAGHPTWGTAMVVLVLILSGVSYLMALRTDHEDVTRGSMAQLGIEIPEEEMQKSIERAEKTGPLTSLLGGLFVPVIGLLLALVFMVVFKLIASDLDFGSSLSVVLHSMMPLAVSSLLSIPVILSKSTIGFEDIRNGSLLASNPAFLASEETSAPLRSLLSSLDVFTFWTLILLAIGYSQAGKMPLRKAGITVFVLWLVCWVGFKVGFSALTSSLMGGG